MDPTTSAVARLAKDLTQTDPRPPSETLGGFKFGARALDKCRATLAGTNGDFQFNCSMDARFFSGAGFSAQEFQEVVATGADDAAVDAWVREHARAPQ